MRTIEGNGKHWVIADYDQSGDTSMVISWCGTTKFDFFAVEHESKESELDENSKIVHVSAADMVDPRFEPLDVIVLHVVNPSWQNARSLTPKNTPEIAFAAIKHDHEEPLKSQMLIFTTVIPPKDFTQMMYAIRCHRSQPERYGLAYQEFKNVLANGFAYTPGTTFFDEEDLTKIASKFRSRIKKAMRSM